MQAIMTIIMVNIDFFDDPSKAPRSREDVRFNKLGIYVHPDGSRRIAIGFDITPFIERPSIEVVVQNSNGEAAGNLTVIETLDANFYLTLHLRDKQPTDDYDVRATLYYATPETGRSDVHTLSKTVDVTVPGAEYTVTS